MKHYRLPFSTKLDRRYDKINIRDFIQDWEDTKSDRQNRMITLDNPLHLQLGKFKTYNVSISEIIDVGMRYALGKQEFKKLMAQLIETKNEDKSR